MMALEGLRIIDMTIWQHGPVSTAMLADMGAEVIKVEERRSGDPGRYLSTWNFGNNGGNNLNYYFENNNRNKKSLALDLKTAEGKEILTRLIKKSDAFVSNFREPSLKRLGFDYEAVHEMNPKLVYSAGYGFGPKGPDSARPSADLAAQARGGIMSQIQKSAPMQVWGGMADQTGAFMLCLGTTMGLLTRERTGIGQKVEESLFGTQLAVGSLMAQGTLFSGQVPGEYTRRALEPVLERVQDEGREVAVPFGAGHGAGLGGYLPGAGPGMDDGGPEVCVGAGQGVQAQRHLIGILEERFAEKTREEWRAILDETDVLWAPVQNYMEALSDEQAIANEYVVEIDHPNAGKVKMLGLPIQFSETPGKVRSGAPELGQHTEEVLTEVLGYSWDEVIGLKDKQVI